MAPPKPMLTVVTPLSPAATERSDDELMLLTRAGRDAAFEVLVRRYQARVLRTAARYLGDVSLAPDVAQRAFVALYHQRESYKPLGKLWPYLSRIVLNQCRMSARSEKRHRGVELLADTAAPEGDADLLTRERRRDVDLAMQALAPKLREVVVLRYASGLSLEEIAEVLHIPIGTVKSRLFTALERLRDGLGAEP